MSDIFGFFTTINEDPEKVDQTMTQWVSFNKIVLQTSSLIYKYVSYTVLLQGTMEPQMEQDFVICEDITMTNSCLHDGVRIFPGILALGSST